MIVVIETTTQLQLQGYETYSNYQSESNSENVNFDQILIEAIFKRLPVTKWQQISLTIPDKLDIYFINLTLRIQTV